MSHPCRLIDGLKKATAHFPIDIKHSILYLITFLSVPNVPIHYFRAFSVFRDKLPLKQTIYR